jgi:DNA-binding beta-propeller fold protein YncE
VREQLRGALAAAAVAASVFSLGACGSSPELPPSPEPASSPAPAEPPAGTVIGLGGMPEGAVVDPDTGVLAVALREPPALALVDPANGRIRRRITLPGAARHLQLVRPGGPVLVPAEDADRLVEVELPRGRTKSVPVGRQPHDAAETAGRILVGDELGDTVSVVEHGRVIRTLAAPVHPGGLAVPAPGLLGVVAVKERKLALYDARRLVELARVNAGVGPTHAVGDGRGRLFVVDTQGDALLVYVTRPRLAFESRTHVAGTPYGIAIDRRRERLYVTTTSTNRVVELALQGRRPPIAVDSYPSVRQPNTLAVDPRSGRVLVLGRARGELQLVMPRRRAL